MPAGNRRNPRHHHFKHRVPDALAIAPVRHRGGDPPAHAELALRLPQQEQTAIRGLVAALKIDCEFLAMNRWQVEGKRYSVGHAAVALRWFAVQFVSTPICYVNRAPRATAVTSISAVTHNPG